MKKQNKILGLLLAAAVCLTSTNIPAVKAEENQETAAESLSDNDALPDAEGQPEQTAEEIAEKTEAAWDGETLQNTYDGEGFKITYTLTDHWPGGYRAEITIENTGETPIENWYLRFDSADEPAAIWNASLCRNEDGQLLIKNAGWNQTIPAGQSVNFGYCGSADFRTFPKTYELPGETTETDKEAYTIQYRLDNDWGTGYTAAISITNNTEETMENWTLTFHFDRTIQDIWCAQIQTAEDGRYTIKNAGYNANLTPGQTLTFGFTGTGGDPTDEPADYCLSTCQLPDTESAQPDPTDTDGDGLTDADETAWGLDPQNPDTDGDGLTDYQELFLTHTDPLLPDTDANGISDAQEDLDGDGLTNLREIQYATDPANADTDGDDLTDYEELLTYDTDPLNPDTDGDGLTDADDVILGFSPLFADTDANGISDADEKLFQTVEKNFPGGDGSDDDGRGLQKLTVTLETTGNAQKNLHILNLYGVDTLSSEVVGLVGVPVEIHTDTPFDRAQLTFHYDETALGNVKEENLSILWYDEQNHWYQLLEDSITDTQNNTVTYTTTHFSTYMLVDSAAWYEAWRENIDYRNSSEGDEKHYYDTVIVTDVSGSMQGDRITLAQEAMQGFVDAMQGEDRTALVTFNTKATVASDFTDSAPDLKKAISALTANGGTNVNAGLVKALSLFEDRADDKEKIVVLICDGSVNYVKSTIASYMEQEIKIYAVNVVNTSSHYYLEKMANETGGQYYYVDTADTIGNVFALIQADTLGQTDTTDTDGDGLYDIYETAGMRLPNGRVIYTDPAKADTDGDGLSDYEETGLIYQIDDRYNDEMILNRPKYFVPRSDPTKTDTDDDGLKDAADPYPWDKNEEWVATLDNRYTGMEYMKVKGPDGSIYDGGNQGWWEDKITTSVKKEYPYFAADPYNRLVNYGCGVIAMTDAELYLTQQNDGYHSVYPEQDRIPYNAYNGVIGTEDYRAYVERNYTYAYPIPGEPIHSRTGLMPCNMESGMEAFLEANDSAFRSATWAPYSCQGTTKQSRSVLDEIETMLGNNIPVVFSYYTTDEDNRIVMYSSLEKAKVAYVDDETKTMDAHYMTIIGLYKYIDEATADYEYILKVVSWGEIYYIRYDQYADNISYFTNILKVSQRRAK